MLLHFNVFCSQYLTSYKIKPNNMKRDICEDLEYGISETIIEYDGESDGDVTSEDFEEQEFLSSYGALNQKKGPKRFRSDIFSKQYERSRRVPRYACSVCCRILYHDEICSLPSHVVETLSARMNVDHITWPVLMYKTVHGEQLSDVNRNINGDVIVCSKHKPSKDSSLDVIYDTVSII